MWISANRPLLFANSGLPQTASSSVSRSSAVSICVNSFTGSDIWHLRVFAAYVPLGFLWFLMVPYGFLWYPMCPYGALMAPYCLSWHLMAAYGCSRLMAPCGSLWLLMAPYGSLYGLVGSLRLPTAPCSSVLGCPRVLIELMRT